MGNIHPEITPGPWKVSQFTEKNKRDDGYTCHVVTDEESPRGFCVANVHANSIFEGDTEATARLIAASPDLLEAAKEALTELYRVSPSLAAPKLRAAISKAEGKDDANR